MARAMKTRATELRRRHRKILMWSLGIAIGVHAAVFALSPTFEAEPMDGSGRTPDVVRPSDAVPTFLDVLFGPPTITGPDGTTHVEARRLEKALAVKLPSGCTAFGTNSPVALEGRVELSVDGTGDSNVVKITERTGVPCVDDVMTGLARDLRYHWLPDERFPAPVHLVQPVTMTPAR